MKWLLSLMFCLGSFAQPNSLQDPQFLERLKPVAAAGGSVTFAYASTAAKEASSKTAITNSITIGATLSSGYIVVGFAYYDAGSANVSSVTFNGSAMTALTNYNSGDGVGVHLYGLAVGNLAASTYSAIVTFSANTDERCLGIVALNGANQSSQTGTGNKASGSSASPSVTVTSATGEMVVGVVMNYGSVTVNAGTGETVRWDGGTSSTTTAAALTEAGAASVVINPSFTPGATAWTAIGFPIKP